MKTNTKNSTLENGENLYINLGNKTFKCKVQINDLECKLIFYSPYFRKCSCFWLMTEGDYFMMKKKGRESYLIETLSYLFKTYGSTESFIRNRLKQQLTQRQTNIFEPTK